VVLHRGKRAAALVASFAIGLSLTACGQGLPPTAIKGTKVTVAWSGPLTSTNTASLTGQTPANLDVAAMTRGRFGTSVKGAFAPDTSFGAVKIVRQKPFTVRYDLTRPTWSDGVPLDAADLLLAWIAGSDRRSGFQVLPNGLAHGDRLVKVDEFGRAITVAFDQPVRDWNAALEPTVPAHVVGRLAFGVEDPMEAKQRIVDAARTRDSGDLLKIAKAWNEGFALARGKAPDPELLVSSGPYRVDEVGGTKAGQRVTLVANGAYVGVHTPHVARIDLVQTPSSRKLAALEHAADVTEIVPTTENWNAVHELERRDYRETPTNDGTMWVLALRATGVFAQQPARVAFLRSVPRSDLVKAGGGPWGGVFESSDMLLSAPGGDAAQVIQEDAQFKEKLDSGGDAAEEAARAGIRRGTPVCVAYDAADPFATAAFRALGPGMADGGWAIRDCGRRGFAPGGKGGWQAMIVRVPVPVSTTELALLWGGSPALNLAGVTSPGRDGMIARLDRTTNIYDDRALRAKIERSIVDDAIALPLAMNPVVVVSSPHVTGVTAQPGPAGAATALAAAWSVVPGQ
jgi:peptide/nickel transport system substrate-binding protein